MTNTLVVVDGYDFRDYFIRNVEPQFMADLLAEKGISPEEFNSNQWWFVPIGTSGTEWEITKV